MLDPSVPHVLALIEVTLDDRSRQAYSIALTGAPLREALPGEGAWQALAIAIAEGRTIAALPRGEDPAAAPTAVLVCRPASGLDELAPDGPGTGRES